MPRAGGCLGQAEEEVYAGRIGRQLRVVGSEPAVQHAARSGARGAMHAGRVAGAQHRERGGEVARCPVLAQALRAAPPSREGEDIGQPGAEVLGRLPGSQRASNASSSWRSYSNFSGPTSRSSLRVFWPWLGDVSLPAAGGLAIGVEALRSDRAAAIVADRDVGHKTAGWRAPGGRSPRRPGGTRGASCQRVDRARRPERAGRDSRRACRRSACRGSACRAGTGRSRPVWPSCVRTATSTSVAHGGDGLGELRAEIGAVVEAGRSLDVEPQRPVGVLRSSTS